MATSSDRRIPLSLGSVVIGLILFGLTYGERNLASPTPDSTGIRAPSNAVQALAPAQRAILSTGLDAGVELGATYSVASERHSSVWYVAGELQRADGDRTVAVWIMTGAPSEPGLLFSLNSPARLYSMWPDSRTGRLRASEIDHEALAVASAVEQR